ncbi:osmoprotectant ABC transporter substrate-binding protein [Paenibacillus selenitireducens]|uniref:Osmoprotectant ABC transporter substrate-binding protein n=2 Tax=Paenibacillus selenitireducens TaxID=1324314 RepID=A0A1T2X2P0_9BACL|nr:glycine betaine ABC transporter substrate-binding protein [Paenibacillus selenitireducens]OPA74168.1 osmoprotectant ABC transporter substrate-binding protein [Paenibacillus selenitireducens]
MFIQRRKLAAGIVGLFLAMTVLLTSCGPANQIIIGTQTFTETKILAEMYKGLIEDRTELKVKVIPDLAASPLVLTSLKRGDIDMGTLYSGEIFNGYFPVEDTKDRDKVLQQAQAGFKKTFDFRWMDSLGFENTYAFTVRRELAEEKGYKKISDVMKDAGNLRLGVDTTWMERPSDGYPAFQKAYGFKFSKEYPMEQSLVYQAVANNQVDIVLAYSTDPRLKAYDLVTLEDDQHFFPPFDASPVIRNDALTKHPEIEAVISEIIGKIDAQTMIDLNYKVDIEKKSEREVAIQYLKDQGYLKEN